MENVDRISGVVLNLSIQMHRDLGPGLLETVYETVLAGQLAREGYKVARQVPVDIRYDGLHFEAAFRIDILVEDTLLIEIKSADRLHASHAKQLLTYLRLTHQPLGLLINFGGATLKEGFRRLVNGHGPSAPLRLCANQLPSTGADECLTL